MKKSAIWILCLAGLLALGACAGQETAAPPIDADAPVAEEDAAPDTEEPAATETATPAPPSMPAPGEALFQDDFSSDASGVDQWNEASSSGLYVEGEYWLSVNQSGRFFWTFYLTPESYTDSIFSLDVRLETSTTDGSVVLMCRYADWNNYYAFALREDGYYRIWMVAEGTESVLLDWQYSDYVSAHSEAFTMAVACIGDQLMLGMDGYLIGEASDAALAEGAVAWGAQTLEGDGLVVAVDNLEVAAP